MKRIIVDNRKDINQDFLELESFDIISDSGNVVKTVALAEFDGNRGIVYGSVIPEHGLHCSNKIFLKDGELYISDHSVGGNFKFPGNRWIHTETLASDDSNLKAILVFDNKEEMINFISENQILPDSRAFRE